MASQGDNRGIPEEIEQRLILFEQNWGQPNAKTIEQILAEVPQNDRPDLLRELLYVEFEFTQRNSTTLIPEQYLSRFPEYESIVREVADAVGQYTVFKSRNIAGYTLLGELGRGGMGVVYRAKSDFLNNLVAFKMINQRMVGNQEALRRFTRELEMMGQLKHPNVVEAKHAGVTPDGSPFLVMELIEGITLTQWYEQNSSSANSQGERTKQLESQRIIKACTIIRDAAQGLQAIHEAGLVHRDIKPGNIMVLADGRVKILDLGLAKQYRQDEQIAENTVDFDPQTRQGHIIGSRGYLAPEQVYSASSVDIRADIYSLGCTLFFLLYGRAPADNKLNGFSASLPKKLRTILDRMLATDPTARFQEPKEIVDALDAFLNPSKKSLWLGIAAAAFVVVCVCIAVEKFCRQEPPPDTPIITVQPPNVMEPPPNGNVDNGKCKHSELLDNAVALRRNGEVRDAERELLALTNKLRDLRPVNDLLLAKVLSARGDCIFFTGLSTFDFDRTQQRIRLEDIPLMRDWYKESLKLTEESSNELLSVLRIKLLCKLAVITGDAGMLPSDDSMYQRFAEAVIAANDGNYRQLRSFVDLKMGSELSDVDLLLFASERLLMGSNDSGDQLAAIAALEKSRVSGQMK